MEPRHWLAENIESVALSAEDLRGMLGAKAQTVRVMLYDDLVSFRSLDELLTGFDAAIILLQIQTPNSPPVGHWIAMLDMETYVEHFDSYGIGIDEELAVTHEKAYLRDMMEETRRPLVQTKARLQARREDVNTCGRWCVARVLMHSADTDDFSRFFKSFGNQPDAMVSIATMFLG